MNKRLLSIFTILVGLLTAGSAISLAWFSTNDYLQVNSVDIYFEIADNLLISTQKDGEYVSSLSTNDLKKVESFIPVSSAFSQEWISLKKENPEFCKEFERLETTFITSGTTTYVESAHNKAEIGFFSQEFYLKSEDNFYATLDCSSLESYLKADETLNEETAKHLAEKDPDRGGKEEILANLNSLASAMRVSILVDTVDTYEYFILDPHKDKITELGGVVDTAYRGTYDVRKCGTDSKNYEIVYGEVSNKEKIKYQFNENENVVSNPTSLYSGHAANTYTFDKEASISNGVEIGKENSISFETHKELENKLMCGETEGIKGNMVLIPLEANKPSRIVISIYLEGWDVDCTNDTMAAAFDCKLAFKLLDPNII